MRSPTLPSCYAFAMQCYFHEQADSCSEDDAERIGGEVEPVTTAVTAGAVGLKEFEESAHEDGQQEGVEEQLLVVEAAVVPEVFPPDDGAGAAIHDEVGPFVDEGNVVEWRLWEKWCE